MSGFLKERLKREIQNPFRHLTSFLSAFSFPTPPLGLEQVKLRGETTLTKGGS